MVANSSDQRRGCQGTGRKRREPGHGAWLVLAMCVVGLGLWIGTPAYAWAAAPGQQPRSCGGSSERSTGARGAEAPAKTAGVGITLNSTQGGPGSKLIAQGSGWPVGAQVVLREEQGGQVINGSRAMTLTVATDGTFVTPAFGAPGTICGFDATPGTLLQIVAQGATDTSLSASASFTYVAAPPALAPGALDKSVLANATTLPVTGSNWDAGTLVKLWATPQWPTVPTPTATANMPDLWQPPAGVPSMQVRADAQGAFSAQVPLPSGWLPLRPGAELDATASATSVRYGTLATSLPGPLQVQPAIAPTLGLDRAAGPAGVAIMLTGDHWWPGDSVRIAYCRNALRQCNPNATQALGSATVDGAGHFSARVALPANARTGPITVEAYVGDGYAGPYLVALPFQVVDATIPAAPSQPASWLTTVLPWLVVGLAVLAAIVVAGWLFARRWRRA